MTNTKQCIKKQRHHFSGKDPYRQSYSSSSSHVQMQELDNKEGCCCRRKVTSLVSNSVRPHRRKAIKLPRPGDSPGNNTGMGSHFILQCRKVKTKSHSRVRLLAAPRTAAYQAPLYMGYSKQKNWSGSPLPSPIKKAEHQRFNASKL